MNAVIENRPYHEAFMREAIEMAEQALRSDETPVGCVFVHDGKIIGRGMNGTNATLNGTRHAEFVALSQITAKHPLSILNETDLYVTVEPCIMCASALRQYRIRAVYFGCLNERFGGCGGVMKLNADPAVDPPYPVYGGLFREEAIMLLRRFYVQENEKAPEPKPKKNRELKTEILPIGVSTTVQHHAQPDAKLRQAASAGSSAISSAATSAAMSRMTSKEGNAKQGPGQSGKVEPVKQNEMAVKDQKPDTDEAAKAARAKQLKNAVAIPRGLESRRGSTASSVKKVSGAGSSSMVSPEGGVKSADGKVDATEAQDKGLMNKTSELMDGVTRALKKL